MVFFNVNKTYCDYYFLSNDYLNFVLGVLQVKIDLFMDLYSFELKPELSNFVEFYVYIGSSSFEREACDRFIIGKLSEL